MILNKEISYKTKACFYMEITFSLDTYLTQHFFFGLIHIPTCPTLYSPPKLARLQKDFFLLLKV